MLTYFLDSQLMILTPQLQEHCRRILDFWHKVEFFIPFDLQEQILESWDTDWAVRLFATKHLDAIAPHNSASLWQVACVPEGKQVSGFDLYLGLFDKSQLGEITQHVVRETEQPLSLNEAIEQDERCELEGSTCFAKIKLNATGEPLLDEISVSTVPWALGRILKHGLASLDVDAFQHSLDQLREELHNFKATRHFKPDETDQPLTSNDIKNLLRIFYDWADFTPADHQKAVIAIRARVGKISKPKNTQESGAPIVTSTEKLTPPTEQSVIEEDDEENECEIDILNSFYARDIQRIIHALDRGELNPALMKYLTPLAAHQRLDLYTEAGREQIATSLHPRFMPAAQWISEPHHKMSLMQQFAINKVFQTLKAPGLFSVNGPPGTGKTTLLRDIFAENITRRARLLANYERATDALCSDARLKVEFEGINDTFYVAPLKPELTGFEMIVASSNNAAVENISRDLPKTKSLGAASDHTYLQSVAWRIAAQNNKGEFDTLHADDIPWGLISATLGKKNNRYLFADRLSSQPQRPNEAPPKGYDPRQHQNIWQWREHYTGLSFAAAKKKFSETDTAVNNRQKELTTLIDTLAELDGRDEHHYCQTEINANIQAQQHLNRIQDELTSHNQELVTLTEKLTDLREVERLLLQGRPVWWKRWINHAQARQHQLLLTDNRHAQIFALKEKLVLQSQLNRIRLNAEVAEAALGQAYRALNDKKKRWVFLQTTLSEIGTQFPQATGPANLNDLEHPDWQINGLWHDEKLNELRSELFASAMDLQQAWLAEVMRKGNGPFSQNVLAICSLLRGNRLSNPTHALAIWQSLFMIVPVISSTFASIASQFRELGSQALGWLIIDEAGQAVPQAAIGALWRCQRAVVVGDPLQIEPVFTVPIKLIQALAVHSQLPENVQVMPHKASVQNLADMANPFGTWIQNTGDCEQWTGSPLRVHRRCTRTIFDIANAIAYEGKMVYGLKSEHPPDDSIDLGLSSWVQVNGRVSKKQVVPEQIELVFQTLVRLHQSLGELPPLYIISPFKQIKISLTEYICDPENWQIIVGGFARIPAKTALRNWCRQHVGTVHTFQGKEKSIVWMVLGCDKEKSGGANWASEKPNLLNVAVTRAQHRLFLIGDEEVWGGKTFFRTARQNLQRITPHEFQHRIVQSEIKRQVSGLIKTEMV